MHTLVSEMFRNATWVEMSVISMGINWSFLLVGLFLIALSDLLYCFAHKHYRKHILN